MLCCAVGQAWLVTPDPRPSKVWAPFQLNSNLLNQNSIHNFGLNVGWPLVQECLNLSLEPLQLQWLRGPASVMQHQSCQVGIEIPTYLVGVTKNPFLLLRYTILKYGGYESKNLHLTQNPSQNQIKPQNCFLPLHINHHQTKSALFQSIRVNP